MAEELNPQLKPVPERLPPPPFAGFVPRLAAFVIDMVLIYFLGYTLEMAFRAPLLELGPGLPFLSHVAAFAYFWLGNGPVGKGATLGKAILNLHVVDAEGRPLGPAASLKRALLQYSLVYMALLQFAFDVVDAPAAAAFFIGDFVRLFGIAMLTTLSYGLIAHPYRRGWHDLWAGAYVTPDPSPAGFAEALAEEPDDRTASRLRSYPRFSGLFFVVMVLLLSFRWVTALFDETTLERIGLYDRIAHEFPVEGYRLENFDVTSGALIAYYERQRREAEAGVEAEDGSDEAVPLAKASDKIATDTLTIRFDFLKRGGPVGLEDIDDPALRGQIEELRRATPGIFQDLAALADDATTSAPEQFAARFSDRFDFVLFSPGENRTWIARGPVDPEQGPLIYDWIENPQNRPPARAASEQRPRPE